MTHEKPCCGIACSCDQEDTWNEPTVCEESDDDCRDCLGREGDFGDEPTEAEVLTDNGGVPE